MTIQNAKQIIESRGDKLPKPGHEVLVMVNVQIAFILRNYGRNTLRIISEQR